MKKVRSLMVRIIPILAVLVVIGIPLLSPAIVQATAVVSLYRGPNPPCYVLNNGATPESFWWKITFDTTPDEATLEIFDPDDLLVYSDTFDLTGATSPVYNPENSVGDPGMTNPAYAYNWSISAGAKAGVYVAVLTFSSEEVPDESAALQTFWVRQRVAVYKYEDENGNHIDDGEPPLSGWNFTVSCPPPHAGHGGITYTAALVLGNPGDSGGAFWGVTNSTGFAVFQSGDPTAPPLCTVGPHLFVDVLNSGGYNVTETLKSGWMNTDPGGSPPYAKTFLVPDPAGATIVVKFGNEELIPGIDVEKYVFDGTSWYDADSPTGPYVANTTNPVVFRFEITNNGTTDLTNVTLTDTDMVSFYTNQACTVPATFPIPTLAEGAATVTVYGKLNWAAGQHSNTATVTGTPPVGPNVSDTDPAHYFGSDPDIDVEKYVYDGTTWHDADAPTGPYILGSINPVVFRFVITNTGNVDLTSVTLSDTDMSAFYTNQACTIPATFPIATLAQGAAAVTVYGKLNWAAGQHSNTATVTGTPPVGPNVSDTDPAHYFGSDPKIDVEKYVYDGTTWHDADTPTGPNIPSSINPVVFRFVITNTGNVDLTSVTLSDTDMSAFYTNQACTTPATFPIPTLAQGAASVTVYGKLNWAAGQHSNTATVTGTPPSGPNVSDTDPAHYFGPAPDIDVEKHVFDGTTWHDADTPTGPYIPSSINPVIFRFVITNTGDVDLTNVTLSDTDMSSFYTNQACTTPATFPIPTLAQGASVTVYGKLNWAAGQHSNTATVTGTPPSGPNVTDTDPAHYFGAQPACVRICKFEDANVNGMWDPGEEYLPDWRFHVTGPGGFDTWVTTGADGCVQVNVPVVGTYTVTEELKPGWYNTRPGGDPPYEQDVMIVGTGTDCTRVEFGNREEIKIVPPNIPTLNQWGIIAMIAVFAGLLVWTVRRRRIAS